MDNKKNIDIALCPSESYALYGLITLKSLILNTNSLFHYNIHILHDSFDSKREAEYRSILPNNFSIDFWNIDKFIDRNLLREKGYVKRNTYYRLLIPLILSGLNKVLYLDSDLIINKDISLLFNYQLNEDELFAGVLDYVNENGRAYLNSEGINSSDYINTGVLLFNCQKLREENFFYKALTLLKKKTYRFFDQDLINILSENRKAFLDPKWNVMWHFSIASYYNQLDSQQKRVWESSSKDPYIIHYTSAIKPWNTYGLPLSEYFFNIVSKFEYANEFYKDYIKNIPDIIYNTDLLGVILKQVQDGKYGLKTSLKFSKNIAKAAIKIKFNSIGGGK